MYKIYKGNVIYTERPDRFKIVKNGYIVVENGGEVKCVTDELQDEYSDSDIVDYGDKMLIPGFVDLHFHASQFTNIGLGFDKELIPWLNGYAFSEEARYKDIEYAKNRNVDMTAEENAWDNAYASLPQETKDAIAVSIKNGAKSHYKIESRFSRLLKKVKKKTFPKDYLLKQAMNCSKISQGWMKLDINFENPIDYLLWDNKLHLKDNKDYYCETYY